MRYGQLKLTSGRACQVVPVRTVSELSEDKVRNTASEDPMVTIAPPRCDPASNVPTWSLRESCGFNQIRQSPVQIHLAQPRRLLILAQRETLRKMKPRGAWPQFETSERDSRLLQLT